VPVTTPAPTEPSEPTAPAGANGQTDVHGELARAIGELTGDAEPGHHKVTDAIVLAGKSAKEAGVKSVASGRWLADILIQTGGHLPVRDLATLRLHHDGKEGQELAEAMIRNASRTSAAVGAATGALVTASQLAVAGWATLPIELLAETLIVVAIELKLVAELHTVTGRPFEGTVSERATAAAQVWSESSGARPGTRGKLGNLGLAAREAHRQLMGAVQRRVLRRAGRNLWSFVPFMIGAAVAAELNRRATLSVGRRVARNLGLLPPVR
jgi:uncharacterized protein (DUF697 family)